MSVVVNIVWDFNETHAQFLEGQRAAAHLMSETTKSRIRVLCVAPEGDSLPFVEEEVERSDFIVVFNGNETSCMAAKDVLELMTQHGVDGTRKR
jgi:hypothetical protein